MAPSTLFFALDEGPGVRAQVRQDQLGQRDRQGRRLPQLVRSPVRIDRNPAGSPESVHASQICSSGLNTSCTVSQRVLTTETGTHTIHAPPWPPTYLIWQSTSPALSLSLSLFVSVCTLLVPANSKHVGETPRLHGHPAAHGAALPRLPALLCPGLGHVALQSGRPPRVQGAKRISVQGPKKDANCWKLPFDLVFASITGCGC